MYDEMIQEETVDTSKRNFQEKLGISIAGVGYGIGLGTLYWVLTQFIPWLFSSMLFFLTLGLIVLVAISLYLYSNKGKKYIFSWPAISLVTTVLLAVFEKLAS